MRPSGSPRRATGGQGMSMKYHLEQQGDKWVVVGKQESRRQRRTGGAMAAAPEPARRRRAAPGAGADEDAVAGRPAARGKKK